MRRAYLQIMSPDGPKKLMLGQTPVTIGRHPDNVIVLEDVQASRFHCVITRDREGGFAIQDLGSRNGTRVNGQLVKSTSLMPGDQITIGLTEMSIVEMGKAAKNGAANAKTIAPVAVAPPPPPLLDPDAEEPSPIPLPPPVAPNEDGDVHGGRQPGAEPEAPIQLLDEDQPPAKRGPRVPAAPPLPKAAHGTGGFFRKEDDGAGQQTTRDEQMLPELAEMLENKHFPAEAIALVNARGQIVHAGASSEHSRPQSPAPSETVTTLRNILLICCRSRATDIHLEPKADDFQLRLRIDGTMVDIVRVSKASGVRLCALVKVLSDIDVQYKSIVQEGHFSSLVPDRRIDYRVSFAPAMFGQKLVIRILDTANVPLHLPDLKLPLWMQEEIDRVSKADSGMILVCGPTGCGKTTTLYATLRGAGVEKRNVVTIEDPVEIEIPGTTQVPVNDEQGNSFAALLRSLLRQDPDVIMVGEIRDAETARIAMQAAMTGHLVLTTLHAKDSIGALFRLLDLGVEQYTLGAGMQTILAQRLVRELCPHCKKPVKLTPAQKEKIGKAAERVQEIYQPAGCPKCLNTGYFGRRAFFEMLQVNDEMREIIMKSPSTKDIEASVGKAKFPRLLDNGYQLVLRGITSFAEIEKVVGR